MKKTIYIIACVLGGLMASCTSLELLTYDQLLPAEITFPKEVKQIGVVNSLPYRTEPKRDILTFGLLEGEGKAAAEALAGSLADSKYFDQVIICDSALQAEGVEQVASRPQLSPETVLALTQDLGVDLLVSYERLWVHTEKKQISYPGWDGLIPVVQAEVTPVVRLYVPGRKQPMTTINFNDSLFFDIHSVLSEKDILTESANFAASKITEKLAPHWIQTERLYYSGGCVEMRDAGVYLREGSWQEAQDLWKELYERLKKGKTKSRAAFNIALSYEMMDNIEQAEQWVKKSIRHAEPGTQEEVVAKHYAEELQLRKNAVLGLNMQMNRFNDNF